VLRDHRRQLDMAEHRRKILSLFSGTLCVDERPQSVCGAPDGKRMPETVSGTAINSCRCWL
jgi:hypothetical protein